MIEDLFADFPEVPAGCHESFLCMCQELLVYMHTHRLPEVTVQGRGCVPVFFKKWRGNSR